MGNRMLSFLCGFHKSIRAVIGLCICGFGLLVMSFGITWAGKAISGDSDAGFYLGVLALPGAFGVMLFFVFLGAGVVKGVFDDS